jgi:hypothetical protein
MLFFVIYRIELFFYISNKKAAKRRLILLVPVTRLPSALRSLSAALTDILPSVGALLSNALPRAFYSPTDYQ